MTAHRSYYVTSELCNEFDLTHYPNHEGFKSNFAQCHRYDTSVVEVIHVSHCYNIHDI